MRRFHSIVLGVTLLITASGSHANEFSGKAALDLRYFPSDAAFPGQHSDAEASLVLGPEYFHAFEGSDQSISAELFFRLNQQDDERTHFDIRELYWETIARSWELRIGLHRVFWGVTESQHLVDIVNQTDLIENVDTEDKLGQPMIDLAWVNSWGTVDFFLLPYFRERTFPGEDGRLRSPLVVDTDDAEYESSAEEEHLDWAVRWAHAIGDFDLGLSHFSGTSREPRLEPRLGSAGDTRLVPVYDLVEQSGLDVQWTWESWLWKLEAIANNGGRKERFYAFTGGFEYTFVGVFESAADIGVLSEYLHDDRGDDTPHPFESDIFLGTRITLNDEQSSEFLSGVVLDAASDATSFLLEASRRLGDSWKVGLEIRAFNGVERSDPLFAFRQDDHIQIEIARHF